MNQGHDRPSGSVLLRLFLAVVPLLLTVLVAWLLMEGHLNLGGGEKDIFLAVPLVIWSFVYLIAFIVGWCRRLALKRTATLAAAIATGVLVIAWLILFGVSFLKFR